MLYKSLVNPNWEGALRRWTGAGLIDDAAALRIRKWEETQGSEPSFRWPVAIALAFGALLLGAGVLLFVSAHWEDISPAKQMALLVALVGLLHGAGAWSSIRFPALSVAMHTIGSFALGAGIALAGQTFHLSAHWPSAILLWAVGAGAAWLLLRHWTQAALFASLVPAWLAGEMPPVPFHPVLTGLCALAITYLSARDGANTDRLALSWIGGVALLPVTAMLAVDSWGASLEPAGDSFDAAIGWTIAIALPLTVAVVLRGRRAVWNAAFIAWSLLLALLAHAGGTHVPVFAWCALGAAGLAAWGTLESRPELINLGTAGFAITVLAFYFSSVMDKLNRSFSLILLGFLFLGGGWLLERARRRLMAEMRP